MADQGDNGFGAPDAYARPGQPLVPTSPWAAYPAPGEHARPYDFSQPLKQAPEAASSLPPVYAPPPAFVAGATALGRPRRASASKRLLAGVGSLAALAVLAAASGVLTPSVATTTRPDPAPPTTSTQPSSQDPTGQAPSRQGTGTAKSSGQVAATTAQSKGVVLINTLVSGGSAAGTGMILDASGRVLTNYHVVQGSTSVKVTVPTTDRTYTATVVGHDATHDVALLQLQDASNLDTVAIDNDAVNTGDAVTAVGNANGQEYLTGASGQITDTSATVTVSNDNGGKETLTDVYETNAQAQPGDSGGPLFDAQNEVTGMTTAGEQTYRGPRAGSASTVASYAIPIARTMAIVKQIESGTASETVKIGAKAYLGIVVSTGTTGSTVVSSVSSGTPAQKAGITKGSTITSIGGTRVSTQPEIAAALAPHSPGDTVTVAWTDASGTKHSAAVTLADSPVN